MEVVGFFYTNTTRRRPKTALNVGKLFYFLVLFTSFLILILYLLVQELRILLLKYRLHR